MPTLLYNQSQVVLCLSVGCVGQDDRMNVLPTWEAFIDFNYKLMSALHLIYNVTKFVSKM